MGIFEKFKFGFQKSASNLASGLKEIIIKKEIDDKTLDKIEDFLISSDVGVDAAGEIKDIISQKKIDPSKDIFNEVSYFGAMHTRYEDFRDLSNVFSIDGLISLLNNKLNLLSQKKLFI